MLFQNKSNAAENLDGTTDLTGKKVHIVNADKTSLNAHYGNTATGFFYADNIDGVIELRIAQILYMIRRKPAIIRLRKQLRIIKLLTP